MEAGLQLEGGSKLVPVGDLNLLGNLGVSGIYVGAIHGTEMKGLLWH